MYMHSLVFYDRTTYYRKKKTLNTEWDGMESGRGAEPFDCSNKLLVCHVVFVSGHIQLEYVTVS